MFIYFNFDDYYWQLMKIPNSVSQKIRILLKTNTKKVFFINVGQLKSMNMESMSMYSTQYLVGAPFAWITAAMRRGMESISLWHCSGVMRAQVALIVAFSSSALLGLAYRILLNWKLVWTDRSTSYQLFQNLAWILIFFFPTRSRTGNDTKADSCSVARNNLYWANPGRSTESKRQ